MKTYPKTMRMLVLSCIVLVTYSCSSVKKEYDVTYEDITAKVFNVNGQLAYKIMKNEQVVIDSSLLGIIVNKKILGSNSKIKGETRHRIALKYPLLGAKNKAAHKANAVMYAIEEADGTNWELEFQVSNEGVAYRYKIPGDDAQTVNKELTTFRLPKKTQVWYFERNNNWKLRSHAGVWTKGDIAEMPTISNMGPIQGLTLTCELPDGGYVLIAESALFNYSGMRLKAIGNNTFKANFTEGEKGFTLEKGDVLTPWRCVVIANDLNDLVNNTLVASLNPKPDERLFADRSWIKPGKAVWYWWSRGQGTYEAEKKMIEDAEKLGMEYSMVDEGWELWDNKWQKVKELCDYGKGKGVDVFLWKRSAQINLPKDNYKVMASFLDSVKMTGAVGVKVDFMNGQTKSLIKFDEVLLKMAAQRHLMVNFHGCQQSSGEYRTYPNEVSREGIRGIELNLMTEGMIPPSHNAALPFTRFVTGHADYTPLAFTIPGETTWAHQLATLICFYSPFQCIAEDTRFLLNSKEIKPALEFIREVPSVWDETIVLSESKIGEIAALARRNKDQWYVGVLNGETAKKYKFKTDFLPAGKYEVEVFKDDLEAELFKLNEIDIQNVNVHQTNQNYRGDVVPFKKEKIVINSHDEVTVTLADGGGSSMVFKLIK